MTLRSTSLLLLLPLIAAPAPAAETRDPQAVAVAKRTLDAMGGAKAFEKVRTLSFDFVAEREGKEVARYHHVWDRWNGRYRVEGRNREGHLALSIFNVNEPGTGRSWLDGAALEGDALKAALERAYARFINDTYWLLAPWKLFDPGVHLAYDGEKPCPGGGMCDVLKLSFENVGLTPKDHYWIWVTRDGRRMLQWQYVLGGASDPPTTAEWKDWRKMGGLMLSLDKPMVGQPFEIRFENVAVAPARDDSLFAPPAAP